MTSFIGHNLYSPPNAFVGRGVKLVKRRAPLRNKTVSPFCPSKIVEKRHLAYLCSSHFKKDRNPSCSTPFSPPKGIPLLLIFVYSPSKRIEQPPPARTISSPKLDEDPLARTCSPALPKGIDTRLAYAVSRFKLIEKASHSQLAVPPPKANSKPLPAHLDSPRLPPPPHPTLSPPLHLCSVLAVFYPSTSTVRGRGLWYR